MTKKKTTHELDSEGIEKIVNDIPHYYLDNSLKRALIRFPGTETTTYLLRKRLEAMKDHLPKYYSNDLGEGYKFLQIFLLSIDVRLKEEFSDPILNCALDEYLSRNLSRKSEERRPRVYLRDEYATKFWTAYEEVRAYLKPETRKKFLKEIILGALESPIEDTQNLLETALEELRSLDGRIAREFYASVQELKQIEKEMETKEDYFRNYHRNKRIIDGPFGNYSPTEEVRRRAKKAVRICDCLWEQKSAILEEIEGMLG